MKVLALILFLSLTLFALDINEAMQRALQNSPSLKEKSLLTKVSHENTNIAYSSFKPNLDFSYGYSQFTHKQNFVSADSASSADAVISYNLFNGFSDLYVLKASEEDEKVSHYAYEAAKADLKLQVNLAYINYLRSHKHIKVAQDTITLLEHQLHDAKNFFEQGLFAKNDYLQVDVELSSAKQALLAANKNVKVSFYRLNHLLGSELKEEETLQELYKDARNITAAVLKEKMLFNRSELKLLNAQTKALNYNYRAASTYSPTIDIQAKYQVAGVDPIPDGGATFQTHDQTTATVNLNWNIYRGGADEANRVSLLYQERASQERVKALHLELEFQLEAAIQEYELSKNQIKVVTKALEQAEENFRITKNQYKENIANTSLMLDAQRFLAQAQVNYYTAYFALYDAMGTLERVVEEKLF